jgi:DNA sulfur modification protein DndB
MNELLLPTLRGFIGDWTYYTCLMKLSDVAERVDFADRLLGNSNLSKLVQRELKGGRREQISNYLISQDQRFFGSLVVASIGGDPEWFQLSKIENNIYGSLQKLPEEVFVSLGILKLTGGESLFALDGQHRLSGIQKAIVDKPALRSEEVSVILVAHKDTLSGMERSRRLFTTLNKKSVPVRIGEVIALDEDDVMAIVTRRLVREHPLFMGLKVSGSVTSNIPISDKKALTTLATLYSILKTLFLKVRRTHDVKMLEGESAKGILTYEHHEEYYRYAERFFKLMVKYYPELAAYMAASSDELEALVFPLRNFEGGHILFRPVGFKAVVESISVLSETHSLERSIKLVSTCPSELGEAPFRDVLFRPSDHKVLHKGVSLASRLIQDMTKVKFTGAQKTKLAEDYSRATGTHYSFDELHDFLSLA